jgi:hypothetical protein
LINNYLKKVIKVLEYTYNHNRERITSLDILEQLSKNDKNISNGQYTITLLNKQGIIVKFLELSENIQMLFKKHIDNYVSIVIYYFELNILTEFTEKDKTKLLLHITHSIKSSIINPTFYPFLFTNNNDNLVEIRNNVNCILNKMGLIYKNGNNFLF